MDDADREEFLSRFEEGLEMSGSQCLGWTFMSNHCNYSPHFKKFV